MFVNCVHLVHVQTFKIGEHRNIPVAAVEEVEKRGFHLNDFSFLRKFRQLEGNNQNRRKYDGKIQILMMLVLVCSASVYSSVSISDFEV